MYRKPFEVLIENKLQRLRILQWFDICFSQVNSRYFWEPHLEGMVYDDKFFCIYKMRKRKKVKAREL